MKRQFHILAVIALLALTTLSAACNKQSAQLPTEATTSAPTETSTQPATEQPTESPTEIPTDAPAPPTEASAPTVDPDAEYKDELTGSEWTLFKVYAGGEEFLPNVFYGSSISMGASIEFYEDDTFHCILGIKGCNGTYSIENGDVNLHITAKYNGTSSDGNPCDEYTPLIWDRDASTIQFQLDNADNLFAKIISCT